MRAQRKCPWGMIKAISYIHLYAGCPDRVQVSEASLHGYSVGNYSKRCTATAPVQRLLLNYFSARRGDKGETAGRDFLIHLDIGEKEIRHAPEMIHDLNTIREERAILCP